MKCKDIPDQVFLDSVNEAEPMNGAVGDLRNWRSADAVWGKLVEKTGTPIPERLFRAKAAKLIERKLLYGCACGCRGDFHTEEY